MAHTIHRRYRGGARPGQGVRQLPPAGWPFVVLAAVFAIVELWPLAEAWQLGASEWWSDLPQLLPIAARSGAMIVLPAAVAWGAPSRYQANRWLWRGALLVALGQLLRYPVNLAQTALAEASGGGTEDPSLFMAQAALGLGVASVSVLGVWALSEGIKDAGGRSRAAIVFAAVLGVATALLLLVPGLEAGFTVDVNLVVSLLSVVVNSLYLLVAGLFAGRLLAGVVRRAQPARAWRIGAVGGWVLLLLPSLSVATLVLNVYVLPQGDGVTIPYLGVATYFGWPLVALALGLGMGRLPLGEPDLAGAGFTLRGSPRVVAAHASGVAS